MKLEIGSQTGAACGEKAPERLAQRNGYHDRDWQKLARLAHDPAYRDGVVDVSG